MYAYFTIGACTFGCVYFQPFLDQQLLLRLFNQPYAVPPTIPCTQFNLTRIFIFTFVDVFVCDIAPSWDIFLLYA